ncbi:MAG: ABC transporter ATP-binding protein [Burkholderiales bacterium]
MMQLEIRALVHGYNGKLVVRGLDAALPRGAIGCLLGPSGCGKTTVLRCIAGFEPIRAGSILLNGALVSGPGVMLPPEARRIGMVFQDYALFPHLSVARNIAFGLHGATGAAREARVRELAELTGLADALAQYPHELSGGQQQRVALARALASRPELLLLDEPFSNLDVDLRERLSLEVREIIKASGATAMLVTHDQNEAFAMADEIGVMRDGRIEQWDSAYNLYHRPANRFVADFVGQGVFLPAKVLNARTVEIELGTLQGDIPGACQIGCDACGKGCLTDILLRPDDVVHDDDAATQAEVVHKAFRGADIMYTLKLESGRRVLALVPSHHNHALGERIGIRLDVDHVVAFQPER